MISEPDVGRCASEDAGSQGGGLLDSMLVGEKNETFFMRVWKPLLIVLIL